MLRAGSETGSGRGAVGCRTGISRPFLSACALVIGVLRALTRMVPRPLVTADLGNDTVYRLG